MQRYDFDRLIDRRGTNCLKYDKLKDYFGVEDALPMWVADMDFATPDFILHAVGKRLEHPVLGYTARSPKFAESLIGWMTARHRWTIDESQITMSPGVVPQLAVCVLAFTNPGDKVIVQSPVYPPFFSTVKDNDRELVVNELINDNGYYRIDFDRFEAQIDDRTRMFILCSPHNPVGRVWSREELERLGEICARRKVLVVSDEIHHDIVFQGFNHTPFPTLSGEIARNSITCVAPTKTFNMAGLNTSAAIIPDKRLKATYDRALYNLHLFLGNVASMQAFEAAYAHGASWLDQMLAYVSGNIDLVQDFLAEHTPEVGLYRPEGTYLLWLDFNSLSSDNEQIKQAMLHHGKIAMNDGLRFGPGGKGYQRLNVACPRTMVEDGLKRIATGVEFLRSQPV